MDRCLHTCKICEFKISYITFWHLEDKTARQAKTTSLNLSSALKQYPKPSETQSQHHFVFLLIFPLLNVLHDAFSLPVYLDVSWVICQTLSFLSTLYNLLREGICKYQYEWCLFMFFREYLNPLYTKHHSVWRIEFLHYQKTLSFFIKLCLNRSSWFDFKSCNSWMFFILFESGSPQETKAQSRKPHVKD